MDIKSLATAAEGFLNPVSGALNAVKGVANLFGIGTGANKAKKLAKQQFEYSKQLQEMAIQQQKEANLELSQYAFDQEVEMWNKQNEYNSPESQMARFKQAGLNPALIYGQGSAGNATNLPSYQAPQVSKANYSNPKELEMQNLAAYNNIAFQRAQINNLNAQTAKTLSEVPGAKMQGNLIQHQINKLSAEERQIIQSVEHRAGLYEFEKEEKRLAVEFAKGNLTSQELQQKMTEALTDFHKRSTEKLGSEISNINAKTALTNVQTARESYYVQYVQPVALYTNLLEAQLLYDQNKINEATYNHRVQAIIDKCEKEGIDLNIAKEELGNLQTYGQRNNPGVKFIGYLLSQLPIVGGIRHLWKASRKINSKIPRSSMNSLGFDVGLDSFVNNK